MSSVFKSSDLWRFVGGFVLGAVALVTLHPSAHARPTAGETAQAR